ncbi:MAG TPA: hypothetical protein O0X39_03795 [Methanocorpusculum sp.]|nr:hypothetical protein [Methanocorpusculum sp.]
MENRRTVTIGVTINLGNYENLHLEVTDTAETPAQAANLRRFLADVLDDFAQNNATAKEAIDKYRERVLLDAESESGAEYESESETGTEPLPFTEPDSSLMFGFDTEYTPEPEKIPEPKPAVPVLEYTEEPAETKPEPEPQSKPSAPHITNPPVTPPEIPEPKPPAAEPAGEFTCERCGDAVSKVQRDVSKMFTGKTLCKKCFNGTR